MVVIARMARYMTLVGLLLALIPVTSAGARQATPVASPTAIDVGECTTEPRSNDEMRALIEAGLPPIVAFMAGTPVGEATPHPLSGGEAADEATAAAVTEIVLQLVACMNAGNLPATAALLTEEGAASYLSFGFLPFREIYAGETGTPTAEIDPVLLNTFLAILQFNAPIPPALQGTLYEIESVTELEDGRVVVIALLAAGDAEPGRTSILLQYEDGRYRVTFGRDTGIGPPSTPTP